MIMHDDHECGAYSDWCVVEKSDLKIGQTRVID